jgi:hypothetical protein
MPTSIQAVIVIALFLMPRFIACSVLSTVYPTSELGETRLISTFRPPVGAVLWFLFLCVGTKSPYPPREPVEMKRRKLQDG